MNLFIERLLAVFVHILGFVVAFSLYAGAVIIIVLLPNAVLAGIKAIGLFLLAILILVAIGAFINWLIIEPFFTKKGVDRK